MIKRLVSGVFLAVLGLFAFARVSRAQDITILFSGETHAMVYHCNCPVEPDGGVARRAALVKQIRAKNPNTMLLDSGAFFAGGLMDENTQNSQMDMLRSLVNLNSMELMKYDAVTVGDDEFNFGKDFFEENALKSKLPFVSANLNAKGVEPYIIKEMAGIKFGIIGATNQAAAQKAGPGMVSDASQAVSGAVKQAREKGADIIILLSHMGESEDLKLANSVQGIDIIIVGHSRMNSELATRSGSTILLRPSWQGRHLGKADLKITNKKITAYNAEQIRLSDSITDDPQVKAILPVCFSDTNCVRGNVTGLCDNPGSMSASCVFTQPSKVSLIVITAKDCRICKPGPLVEHLTKYFPGLSTSYLYYTDQKAAGIIKDLNIRYLPAYLLGREAEKEKPFEALKPNLELKGDYYMLKPEFSGISYVLSRPKIKDKLDLSISLFDKDMPELLDAIADFKPDIHFIAAEKDGKFATKKGIAETEEDLRSVCVQKIYPEKFWSYITCRSKNINSTWWEDCLAGADAARILACARSEEGAALLKKDIDLNKELGIVSGPTYLRDNQEIFSTQGTPNKVELKKILTY